MARHSRISTSSHMVFHVQSNQIAGIHCSRLHPAHESHIDLFLDVATLVGELAPSVLEVASAPGRNHLCPTELADPLVGFLLCGHESLDIDLAQFE